MHARNNVPQKRALSDASSRDNGARTAPTAPDDRLKTVQLELSEKEHEELDKRVFEDGVLRTLMSLNMKLNDEMAPHLLTVIINRAQPKCSFLDPTYSLGTEAEELLKRHPGMIEDLKEAWKLKGFAHIRSLEILQRATVTPTQSPQQRIFNTELQVNAITSAWRQPYRGTMHELLYKNINQMTRIKAYSNSVAIIQSSGTGKSRMVHEQSNLVFTIPFNLREQTDDSALPYPHPDASVRHYLADSPPRESIHDIKIYYLVFLQQLFEKIEKELRSMMSGPGAARDYTDLAECWRVHLEDGTRKTLYESVITNAHVSRERIDDICTKYRKDYDKTTDPDPLNLHSTAKEAQRSLDILLSAIDDCIPPKEKTGDGVKVVMYFDEAHVLTKEERVPPNPDNKSLYDVLCSCFNYFLRKPIFFIFLSTNSSLETFAPSSAMAKSARARENRDSLQAPITEVAFDCCDDLRVLPGVLTLKDVCSIEFMAKFGRPLFWTLLKGAGGRKNEMVGELVDLARAKLLRRHNINVAQTDLTPSARLAVVDIRLMLDYEPRREAIQHQSELVASHMRIAYSVPKDRVYLRSGYPSEPILAEAAAQQMHTFRKYNASSLVDILGEHTSNGLLDRGERGELVARTILTLAYDRAVEADHRSVDGTPLLYSQGCSVTTFIEQLFSEEYASAILDSLPDNISGGVTFREAFKEATIRFTHFAKMADDSCNSPDAMFAAFVRGMAMVCRSGQRDLDFLLPVLLRDDRLSETVMTAVMVQVKRRLRAGTEAAYIIDEKAIRFFPSPSKQESNAESPPRPYITLLMEVGVQNKVPDEFKTVTKVRKAPEPLKKDVKKDREVDKKALTKPPPTTPSKVQIPQQGRNKYARDKHPRYRILAYGCSSKVYKVIGPDEKAKFALLLAHRDFLAEHPRTTRMSIDAVRRMKPFWAAGVECYHWFVNVFLNTAEARDDPGAGWVVAGGSVKHDEDQEMY